MVDSNSTPPEAKPAETRPPLNSVSPLLAADKLRADKLTANKSRHRVTAKLIAWLPALGVAILGHVLLIGAFIWHKGNQAALRIDESPSTETITLPPTQNNASMEVSTSPTPTATDATSAPEVLMTLTDTDDNPNAQPATSDDRANTALASGSNGYSTNDSLLKDVGQNGMTTATAQKTATGTNTAMNSVNAAQTQTASKRAPSQSSNQPNTNPPNTLNNSQNPQARPAPTGASARNPVLADSDVPTNIPTDAPSPSLEIGTTINPKDKLLLDRDLPIAERQLPVDEKIASVAKPVDERYERLTALREQVKQQNAKLIEAVAAGSGSPSSSNEANSATP